MCIGQFVWTMREERQSLGWSGIALSVFVVFLRNVGFAWLWRIGDKLERRSMPMIIPHPQKRTAS